MRYGQVDESSGVYFESIRRTRYALEPYIHKFAGFDQTRDSRVLEIGIGTGTDFYNWIVNGARPTGVDLTRIAGVIAREYLQIKGVAPDDYCLYVPDAEHLPFSSPKFEMVYSWGVLHHTEDTERALSETYRVLLPGGTIRAMIYHVHSWTGWLLWIQHGLLRGNLGLTVRQAIYQHLESFGTKAYTLPEAKALLENAGYSNIRLSTRLGPGDLLQIRPSRKYRSFWYRCLWKIYPRSLVKWIGNRFGLYLLIEAQKSAE